MTSSMQTTGYQATTASMSNMVPANMLIGPAIMAPMAVPPLGNGYTWAAVSPTPLLIYSPTPIL